MIKSRLDSEEFVISIAQVLKAIAHPVRIQILAALRQQNPLNVTELLELISIDVEQPLLSHHLIKMRNNGVLKSKREGMFVYYGIADEKLFKVLDCMENCDII